jgi:hypothetical protein
VLLWPVVDARLQVEGAPGGLHVLLEAGTWADVPIRGELFWEEEPGRRVTAQLVASSPVTEPAPSSAPSPAPPPPPASRSAVRGSPRCPAITRSRSCASGARTRSSATSRPS